MGCPFCILVEERLTDLDISRAGVGMDVSATAINCTVDVMAVEASLHRDGLLDIDAAGAGIGVEVEACAASDGEVNVAGARAEPPIRRGLALDFNVAGTGAGLEGSGDTTEGDVSAAGLCFDVARRCLLKLDIAGACAEDRRTGDAEGADVT